MRRFTLLLMGLLFAGAVLPDLASDINLIKANNPCGRIICCCPEMCRMARKAKLLCHVTDAHTCGLRSTADRINLAESSSVSQGNFLLDELAMRPARGLTWSLRLPSFELTSARHSPLDKPPPILA